MKSSKPSPNEPPATTTALQTAPGPLAQTILWMLQGQRATDIAEAVAANFPGENADALIEKANDHFAELADADVSVLRGWCLEATCELYRRMFEIGDFTGALKALGALMKYTGGKCSERTNKSPKPSQ